MEDSEQWLDTPVREDDGFNIAKAYYVTLSLFGEFSEISKVGM